MFLHRNLNDDNQPINLNILFSNHPAKAFRKGEYIFMQGGTPENVYVVKSGKVKTGTYGPMKKEITKNIIGENEVFGELALIQTNSRMNDFAVATEKTVAYAIPIKKFRYMMQSNPNLMLFVMEIIGSRKNEMERRLESLYFKDSRTRIIEFLYNLSNDKGERVGFETVIRKGMTHQEIANLTATSRQTVTTVLNELRSRNIIAFNRRRFLIRDMDILQREGRVAVAS